jgi:hypothetical protein
MAVHSDHPLRSLEERRLGPYDLRLSKLAHGEKSGWTRFALRLGDAHGDFEPALIEGLYSVGGRGVPAWMEVLDYRPELWRGPERLDLAAAGLDQELFRRLSDLIPAGGHLMVGCETQVHQSTYQALLKGVPPVATPLGKVLFGAGFHKVKFFYLAEGGWEGQQKLWAEKPLNPEMERTWAAQTARELERFLAGRFDHPAAQACLASAQDLLEQLNSEA